MRGCVVNIFKGGQYEIIFILKLSLPAQDEMKKNYPALRSLLSSNSIELYYFL